MEDIALRLFDDLLAQLAVGFDRRHVLILAMEENRFRPRLVKQARSREVSNGPGSTIRAAVGGPVGNLAPRLGLGVELGRPPRALEPARALLTSGGTAGGRVALPARLPCISVGFLLAAALTYSGPSTFGCRGVCGVGAVEGVDARGGCAARRALGDVARDDRKQRRRWRQPHEQGDNSRRSPERPTASRSTATPAPPER